MPASPPDLPDPNGTIFQAFHSYIPDEAQHWQLIQAQVNELVQAGFTALWLPGQPSSSVTAAYAQMLKAAQQEGLHVYTDADADANADTCIDTAANASVESSPSHSEPAFRAIDHLDARLPNSQPLDLGPHSSTSRRYAHCSLFQMGEYWTDDIEMLHQCIKQTGGERSFLDIPLHINFHRASRSNGYYDMSKLLHGTLIQQQPALAVTFVENHRSQPLQRFESVVEPWFKPLAYATILLRREGYPCVFDADYYGAHYYATGSDGQEHEIWLDSHRWLIDKFLDARRNYAHGPQYDYFDQSSVVGWTRLGRSAHPKPMAVLMSDGWGGSKWMEVGKPNAVFYDLTEHVQRLVYTNRYGWGEFHCRGGSVSVWVEG
jgi:hypothetical protein